MKHLFLKQVKQTENTPSSVDYSYIFTHENNYLFLGENTAQTWTFLNFCYV